MIPTEEKMIEVDLEQRIMQLAVEDAKDSAQAREEFAHYLAKTAMTKYDESDATVFPGKFFAHRYESESPKNSIVVSKKFAKQFEETDLNQPVLDALTSLYVAESMLEKAHETALYAHNNGVKLPKATLLDLAETAVKKKETHIAKDAYDMAMNQYNKPDISRWD